MKHIFLYLLTFASLVGFSQTKQPCLLKRIFKRAPYDTSYVDSYYDHFLHVTGVGILQNQNVRINSSKNNLKLNFSPNTAFRFGIGLDYRYLSFEYSRAIEQIDKQDPLKGDTKSFSLRLGVTGRRLLGSLLIQSYKGLYLSNPQSVDPNWKPTDPYPTRNDIVSEVLLGSINYFFNHTKYSTMASLWQIDRQKKSAGSFTIGLTASITHLSGDSSFAPYNAVRFLNLDSRIIEGKNSLWGINVGYGYNFIFMKNFFLNGTIIPGINMQGGEYTNAVHQTYKTNIHIGYHGDMRLIGGYNGERYYGGAYYSNYYVSNKVSEGIDVNIFNGYLRFFIGKRFDLTTKHKK